MINKCLSICIIFILMVCGRVCAVEQPLALQKAFQLSAAVQDSQTLRVRWNIAKNYYLYRDRINFRVRQYHSKTAKIGPQIMLGYINWPESQLLAVPHIGKYQVYSDELDLAVPLQTFGLHQVVLDVYYQGCSRFGFCYPPATKAILLNMQTTLHHFIPMTLSHIKSPSNRFTKYKNWHMNSFSLYALLSFFGFGILLAFTPCQWPMYPILSAIIIGRKQRKLWRDILLAIGFVLGMSITYAVIGMVFAMIGESLQPIMQKPIIITITSFVIAVMAFSLFGLYQINLPNTWQQKLTQVNQTLKGGQFLSVILMGVLSSLVLSPCVTPPLLSALTFIAHKGDVMVGIIFLTVLAWGMGLPVILFVVFGSQLMPKSGPWMVVVQRILGCILFAVAVWNLGRLLSWQFMVVIWGIYFIVLALYWAFRTHHSTVNLLMKFLSVVMICYAILFIVNSYRVRAISWSPFTWFERVNHSMTHRSLNFIEVTSLQQLKNILQQAKHGHKNILLDYYADWCVACKKMEQNTFSNIKIKQALTGWVLIRVNITKMTADDSMMMQQYNVIAPPVVMIFYKQNNQYLEKHLVGEQASQSLLDILQTINGVDK